MSIESVMPSNHLILCRPLLLLPSIFPSIRVLMDREAWRAAVQEVSRKESDMTERLNWTKMSSWISPWGCKACRAGMDSSELSMPWKGKKKRRGARRPFCNRLQETKLNTMSGPWRDPGLRQWGMLWWWRILLNMDCIFNDTAKLMENFLSVVIVILQENVLVLRRYMLGSNVMKLQTCETLNSSHSTCLVGHFISKIIGKRKPQ